jgi:CO/xanthine dehydrogenase Mo-binding subunit
MPILEANDRVNNKKKEPGSDQGRRQFLKLGTYSVAVSCLPISACMFNQPELPLSYFDPTPPKDWSKSPGQARFRVEGFAKVTGQKIFARDFRARDFPSWPNHERSALILRSTQVDKVMAGINLSMLPNNLKPLTVVEGGAVTGEGSKKNQQLKANGIVKTVTLAGLTYPFLVQTNTTADFFGQPVAILIFENAKVARRANKILQFNEEVVVYGGASSPTPFAASKTFPCSDDTPNAYFPCTEYVRVVEGSEQQFSYASDNSDANYQEEVTAWRAKINQTIKEKEKSGQWQGIEREYSTQAMDPMFMEPESGLAWFDSGSGELNLILGTQSPDGDISECASLFDVNGAPIKPSAITLYSCYPGGGFGGRDKSYFTFYLALAAAFTNGQPVRLAYDRFEQFQYGLKRHACSMRQQFYANKKTNQFEAVVNDLRFDGGGRKNLSPYVASLAALCAGNGYEFSMASIRAHAYHSTSISGGSQRGFGGPQAFLALESAIDEWCKKYRKNIFDVRRKNVLEKDGLTVVGGPVMNAPRFHEILNIAESHPLWKTRNKIKPKDSNVKYGVGFAMSMQAFGTSGDGLMGYTGIDATGKINVITNAVDMGNGSATTLAVVPYKALGKNANDIEMGQAAFFNSLDLTYGGKVDQWNNPRWVKKLTGSSSACLTAFHQVHAVEASSEALVKISIIPGAVKIWQQQGQQASAQGTYVNEEGVHCPGCTSLSLTQVAGQLGALGLPQGILAHAYFQGTWVKANYDVNGASYQLPIDAMGLDMGNGVVELVDRKNTQPVTKASASYARTVYAPCGNLIAVEVNKKTGAVKVVDSVTILNSGPLITPQLVEGQSEGGLAMAIGYTLMEDVPLDASGPANGKWNLNQYHVPLAKDVPFERQQLICLDPLPHETAARGIAEAVMCSVSPAIINAIDDAIDKRFYDLPVTPSKIKAALS